MKESEWCRLGFGLRVRTLRMLRDWTQQTAASRCHMDVKSFGAIERGERNISLHIIARIGRGFGVELPDLFLFSSNTLSARSGRARNQVFKAIGVAPPQQRLRMLGILNEVIKWKQAQWRPRNKPPVSRQEAQSTKARSRGSLRTTERRTSQD